MSSQVQAPGLPDTGMLSVKARCRMAWASEPLGPEERLAGNLQSLSLMEGVGFSRGHDTDDEAHADLLRLERKLDTALSMLAQLTRSQNPHAQAVDLELGSQFLRWPNDQFSPEIGQPIDSLAVWLSAMSPLPVQFLGVLDADQANHFVFRLQLDDSQMKAEWERLIFRWHRRDVARGR